VIPAKPLFDPESGKSFSAPAANAAPAPAVTCALESMEACAMRVERSIAPATLGAELFAGVALESAPGFAVGVEVAPPAVFEVPTCGGSERRIEALAIRLAMSVPSSAAGVGFFPELAAVSAEGAVAVFAVAACCALAARMAACTIIAWRSEPGETAVVGALAGVGVGVGAGGGVELPGACLVAGGCGWGGAGVPFAGGVWLLSRLAVGAGGAGFVFVLPLEFAVGRLEFEVEPFCCCKTSSKLGCASPSLEAFAGLDLVETIGVEELSVKTA
jgi:hypothetical protein